MLSLSAEGVVTGWSPGTDRFLGYPAHEVEGGDFSSWTQDPSTLERAFGQLRENQSAQTVCLTIRVRSKNGEAPAFMCLDALRDQQGQFEGCLVTLRDARSVVFEAARDTWRPRLAVPNPGELGGLTPRQRLVLELIARGHSTREIAKRLNRSVKTIETHRAQLMNRLNVHHVPGLVGFAIRAGLVTVE